jgi:hypothetical protein
MHSFWQRPSFSQEPSSSQVAVDPGLKTKEEAQKIR